PSLDLFRRRYVEDDVARALGAVAGLGDEAEDLARRLSEAAEGYGRVERAVTGLARSLMAQAAAGTGALLASPLGLVASLAGVADILPGAAALAALFAVLRAARGVRRGPAGPGVAAREAPDTASRSWPVGKLICSVEFVALLRLAVSSVDDFMLGAAHLPRPIAALLDDDATGLFGLAGSARAFLGLPAVLGLLRETPVRVTKTETMTALPPRGFADLARRVPAAGPGRPQVRVEEYPTAAGGSRWIVYVGGTVDMAVRGGKEPFDNTSNVHGVAQSGAAAVRTTVEAMRESGVGVSDPVTLVGYSQGGLAVNGVARVGGYRDVGVVTFGSPTGGVVLPDVKANIAVEIAEDPIPALGGEPAGARQGGLSRTVVTRRIYGSAPPPAGETLPAHDLERYRETAEVMDRSGDPRLVALIDRVAATTGATGSAARGSLWRGERVAAG
ncbi:MAG TPA: hypothetical protein VFQ96_07735, partial [Microbacteriaceae bacterium]|nr:hypothetical protein [Microbacteriaceae bacterium]